jgi:four helix bundle protein
MDEVVEVYAIAKHFPRSETYALRAQLTRAVVSVPANIAEGASRSTKRDYSQFLAIAKGSLAETETLLAVAVRLGYVTDGDCARALALADEIGRMLTTLRQRLRT